MNNVSKICKRTHKAEREPITCRFCDPDLVLHIMREVSKRITLLQTTLFGDQFIAAGK